MRKLRAFSIFFFGSKICLRDIWDDVRPSGHLLGGIWHFFHSPLFVWGAGWGWGLATLRAVQLTGTQYLVVRSCGTARHWPCWAARGEFKHLIKMHIPSPRIHTFHCLRSTSKCFIQPPSQQLGSRTSSPVTQPLPAPGSCLGLGSASREESIPNHSLWKTAPTDRRRCTGTACREQTWGHLHPCAKRSHN